MTLPDFLDQGYEVTAELDRDSTGCWAFYLARAKVTTAQAKARGFDPRRGKLAKNDQVVIKLFQSQSEDPAWNGPERYEREKQLLQELDHPAIPRFLDGFETPQGFCLVQPNYKAIPLTERRSFHARELKSLTYKLLRALVYLHNRIPPMLHGDLRPETLWIEQEPDPQMVDSAQVYLMGFGPVGIPSSDPALATPGMTAPEQFLGQPLTPAADLYSLGGTLISLLTGIPSQQLVGLVTDRYEFDLSRLPQNLDPEFVNWLEKLVAPNPQDRYPTAQMALDALEPLAVNVDENKKGQILLPVNRKWAIAALAILVPVGALSWLTLRPQAPRVPTPQTAPVTVVSSQSDSDLVKQGDRFLNDKRYEEAVTAYQRATQVNPNNASAWFGWGLSLIRLGRYEAALPPCTKATELNPQDATAWYNRGVVLGRLDRYAEAIPMYDKSLALDATDPMTWLNKGFALYNVDRKQEAIAAYDQALKLKPDYALVWNNRCLILNDWQRYQEALPDCQKATQYDPQLHFGWNNKGEALYHLGRYQEALVAFNKALEIKPDYQYALEGRKLALEKLKQ